MKISKTLLPVVAVASLFSGCQDEDFGYEAQDIKYQKEFKAAFGNIDPNQDFNLATRASVTVSTTSPSRIKIYAKHGDRYKLVGDYAEVSGTQTLGIDVVEGTIELRVSNGSFAQETTVGGSVSFSGGNMTRGIVETSISTKTTEMFEMSAELATAWVKIIPERGSRSVNNTYGTNLGKVIQDFTYVSNGPFTMYPMFSWTSNTDQIGIYYTDANGVYHETIVMNNNFSGNDLQYMRYKNESNQDDPEWHPVNSHLPAYGNNNIDGDGTHTLDNIKAVKGHGVTIDLPRGTVFGMYMVVGGSVKYYSESALNPDVAVTDTDNGNGSHTITVDPTKHACHAASFYCTVEGKEYQFLGFEDWDNGTFPNQQSQPSDFDLNDFMVLFDGTLPHVNDEETPGWILAYEDLGNDFDWDYNDIVAKVQHVSGQDYATFTALAAVGTLDSYVKYNGEYITGNKATSEVHAMFGAEDEAPHAIINGTSKGASGTPINFTVPTDFSMTVLGSTDDMGGISLVVENKGEFVANVEYAEEGNTPKVLCLPEFWYDNDNNPTYKYEWAWPTEHSSIKCVYPEFAAWVSNKNSNTEWYKHPAECTPGVEGKPGDDTKGSYVSGVFQTKMASGTISERADQPITILQNPVYIAKGTSIDISKVISTQSNGTMSVLSADNSIVNYRDNQLYGAAVGKTTITIHQLAGTDKTDADKMWPTCDETIEVIVLDQNNIVLGTIYNGQFSEKQEITLEVGESINLYFKSNAQLTAITTYKAEDADLVTIGEPDGASTQLADGYATITGVQAGTTTITVSQDKTDSYMAASKTISVIVKPAGIDCAISEIESFTPSWGGTLNGQTITLPSEGIEAGDILKITSNGKNKDFGSAYGLSDYAQGNRAELTLTEAMISNGKIYVTLWESDEITRATIKKP